VFVSIIMLPKSTIPHRGQNESASRNVGEILGISNNSIAGWPIITAACVKTQAKPRPRVRPPHADGAVAHLREGART
jgi:hypothetical protein